MPACLNGLLDIDLATQKDDLSFYPISKAALQFHKSFQGGLVRDRDLASFFLGLFPCNSVQRYFQESFMMFYGPQVLTNKADLKA